METGALAVRATGLQQIANQVAYLFRFLMRRVLLAETTILAELQFLRSCLFVLGRRVIALLALGAAQRDDISHCLTPFTLLYFTDK